jgi:hypothetical protein
MVVTPTKIEIPDALAAPQDRLLALFRREFQPLFALLDAARDPMILKLLLESKEEYQSLYQGAQGEKLVNFAPYLVRLPQQSPLLEKLVVNGWGKSWGVFLTCDKSLQEVRSHFRHFLMVKTEAGKDLYFRFYDPRVLGAFLPSCTSDEIKKFFGPVRSFLLEDQQLGVLLNFKIRGGELEKVVVPLLPSEPTDTSASATLSASGEKPSHSL